MRLIEVGSLEFQEFIGNDTPPYAILSHTWEDEEVSFQEMLQLTSGTRHKKGFTKIRKTCRLAARMGFRYAWVDTCCIDKSSSAELTEAINSMYRWYRQAAICYAFLSDVDDPADEAALASSRWFTRGWTLQELIAPQNVIFWSRNWVDIGTKLELCNSLQTITNIPADLLKNPLILDCYSIARRMSWAAKRETTRVEDTAYCLLGLFNINMSLLYGEGRHAFYRLQEELVKSTTDASLFAWSQDGAAHPQDLVSVFADHPRCFANSKIPPLTDTIHESMTITNRGIALRVSLGVLPSPTSTDTYVLCLGTVPASPENAADTESRTVCIYLRQTLPATFSRYHRDRLPIVSFKPRLLPLQPVYLATREALPFFHWPMPWRLDVPREYMNRISRISTLQIEPLPEGIRRIRVSPISNFDTQDGLFFSTSRDPVGGGWASFRVKGVFTSPTGIEYPLDLICYIFGWARTAGEIGSVLVNPGAELREDVYRLQNDLTTRQFERDCDRIQRMLAQFGNWTSEVAVSPDTWERGAETEDVMVATLSIKRLNVQTLGDYGEFQAPCPKNCVKVEVIVVPREESREMYLSRSRRGHKSAGDDRTRASRLAVD